MQELYELKEKKMCNNAFLLGKLMDNQAAGSAYVPSANHGLIANELESVEPLEYLPSGKLYYLDYQYNNPNYVVHSDGTIVLTPKRNRKLNNKLYYE